MATIPVKFYTNLMQGAPQLTGTHGELITMLDACLANGFNLKAVTSMTSAGGIATVNIAAGHLYQVDQVIAIAGADQAEYNGEFRALSTTSNSFTFAITGSPASPATGASITAKVAPLNFQKVYSGTNKGVYRSTNALSNKPYLRVDNSLDPASNIAYAKKGKVTMAEGMTDVDTFVGARAPYDPLLPTRNEIGTGSGTTAYDGWYKWYYARTDSTNTPDNNAPNAGNRSWVLVGDDRGFYFICEHNFSVNGRVVNAFTDFDSFRAGDGYNTMLAATEFWSQAGQVSGAYADKGNNFSKSLDYEGKVLMRDHLQVGNTVRVGFAPLGTMNAQQTSGYATGVPWPNGPDYSLVLHPIYLMQETGGHLRGKLPGIMWVHNNSPLTDLAVVGNVTGYAGRKFLMVKCANQSLANTAMIAFDVTGPWW